jgi:hypothetical protein
VPQDLGWKCLQPGDCRQNSYVKLLVELCKGLGRGIGLELQAEEVHPKEFSTYIAQI